MGKGVIGITENNRYQRGDVVSKRLFGLFGALLFIVVVVLAVIFLQSRPAQSQTPQAGGPTDPQHLLIPRWFLREMTVDGKSYEVPEQSMNLQFQEDGGANGKGGCNEFSSTYQAGQDGVMKFGPVASTKMACDEGMDRESAFFKGLEQVQNYAFVNGKLTMTSADGQTRLVFSMPPK